MVNVGIAYLKAVREGVTVPYAILSHRWRTGEILFADVQDREIANSYATRSKRGYNKLRDCCRIVLKQWLNHVWIDTCCIDKSSSAELSEAINSMYKYYTDAQFCITYLDDVADDAPKDSFLEGAVWFSRGWTLQELIASRDLRYYSEGWTYLGSKKKLLFETSRASGVTESILSDPSGLSNVCVSEKMSWAARRTTKRAEDQAYALMGIFGVNMPPLYGEGAENAFRRLQLEIIATTPDHTIFAWDAVSASGDMLAPGVSHFRNGDDSTVKVSVGVTKMQNVITSCNVYVQSMRQMLRHE
ncbi:HET-domain-containing protein [Plenodomus tracheiphilus IPT5]|uniref:HET-domain-containing protein n=1 Tax=Plenodomus tracheiphilus IPT5 TaxID=1408161 RepID=A0A6A7BB10_9PLEO|nr:HET-domain-containing protein [Plenodomus tracheiphilus IPT5]